MPTGLYSLPLERFIRVRDEPSIKLGQLFDSDSLLPVMEVKKIIASKLICNFEEISNQYPNMEQEKVVEELYSIAIRVHPDYRIAKLSFRTKSHKKRLTLKSFLSHRIFGQEEAVDRVCGALDCHSAGITDPSKPICSLLFVGPTGVGKTELAKALASYVGSIFRINCAEYAEAHEYAKLIGAPPGYIGFDNGGFLSKMSDFNGTAVTLFDEIEKAHERLHNLLLSILDEGTVMDAQNNAIDFRDKIVIMTSNVGTRECSEMSNRAGFNKGNEKSISDAERSEITKKALSKFFKPEFLNRIDEIVLFNSLKQEHALRIFKILMGKLNKRCLAEMKVSKQAMELVVQKGFSEAYGAREMNRTFRKMIEIPIAKQMLAKNKAKRLLVTAQNDVINVFAEGEDAERKSEDKALRRTLGG